MKPEGMYRFTLLWAIAWAITCVHCIGNGPASDPRPGEATSPSNTGTSSAGPGVGSGPGPTAGSQTSGIPASGAGVPPSASSPGTSGSKTFWDDRRRGANLFDVGETRASLLAAKATGVDFVRFALARWGVPPHDFLLGSADGYNGLDQTDLAQLLATLDLAQAVGLKVELAMLSLPGDRWQQQQRPAIDDSRLWTDQSYHAQAIRFWTDLAAAVHGHPALVAYNVLNEPHAESALGFGDFWTGDINAWYQGVKGTPGDLNQLYRGIVGGIRSVDPDTPIVLDAGSYGNPRAFRYLQPIPGDDKIIYAFHMYEPFQYTSHKQNGGQYRYPGTIPVGSLNTPAPWDRDHLTAFLGDITQWQTANHIPSSRIYAEEFGVSRVESGATDYLGDLIGIFEDNGWHWAFYAFSEDDFPEKDYELGTDPLVGNQYPGADVLAGLRHPNPLWDVIASRLTSP